jgi:60 kDa SS-A/Ro ribonucleoprotein
MRYADYLVETPQTQPMLIGTPQVQNNAGGHVYQVSKWEQLRRFLILGSEGGTYYAGESTLSLENAKNVVECIREDGRRAVAEIVAVSKEGRAPKNDPAIFALALVCSTGDEAAKGSAYTAITQVCRTGTHIFQFCDQVNKLRGWSRGLRRGVGRFYEQPAEHLEYQMLKYQQRNGWTHRDVLRLSHPKPASGGHNSLFLRALGKPHAKTARMEAIDELKTGFGTPALIRQHALTREMVPTELLSQVGVWDALLHDMPVGAVIRNLGKMSAIGLITQGSAAEMYVAALIQNEQVLQKARIHPLNLLIAYRTYKQGHGDKGKLTWTPSQRVVAALDRAFYLSFKTVKPTGKRHLLAVDISGSMDHQLGNLGISCREAAACMALVTARVEGIRGFMAFTTQPALFPLDPEWSLEQVTAHMQSLAGRMGSTDCALPMVGAKNSRVAVDAFVVYTDSETWAGKIHPKQALDLYRREMKIPAKCVVVGMTASKFTIADPNDAGMLDVVGFDTTVPSVISEFVGGGQ